MLRREDCRLRPITEADLEKVLQWRNSDRIRANMYTDHLISMSEHRAWFKDLRSKAPSTFMIFEYKQKPAGTISVSQSDHKNSKCAWGFYLGESDLPRGCGTVMGYLGLNYIFDELKYRKVCGEVFAFNLESIRFHRKLGFVKEGRFIKHILKNGRYEDIVFMALFSESWMKRKKELESDIGWN